MTRTRVLATFPLTNSTTNAVERVAVAKESWADDDRTIYFAADYAADPRTGLPLSTRHIDGTLRTFPTGRSAILGAARMHGWHFPTNLRTKEFDRA